MFSGTVRQNILFGMEFEEERYWNVIKACALKHDLAQWEFGDRTLVGERGVSLSGNAPLSLQMTLNLCSYLIGQVDRRPE